MNRGSKAIALTALSAVALFASSAHASDSPWKDLSSAQRRGAMQVIRCARDLAERGGFFPGGTIAAETLQQLSDQIDDVARIRSIARDCAVARKSLFSGKMEQEDPGFERQRKRDAEWLALSNFPYGAESTSRPLSSGVQSLMYRFLTVAEAGNSIGSCKMAGPEVMAALGVGFEAGVKGGLCTAYDGRRWLAVGASAGVVLGIGAMAGVHIEEASMDSAFDAEVTPTYGLAAGPAIAFSGDSAPADPSSVTVGLGLGAFVGLRADADVRLIPVGDARRKLIEGLLSAD